MDLHFAEKCIIFVLAKRREPINKGFSPLFSCENGPKNHCFTKHIEKFICRSGFSKCFCGFFPGQVGARIDDIETRKVKRYLFSTLHFFFILGNYSGRFLQARGAIRRAPEGQPARRPGQSEAARWVLSSVPCCRPARARANIKGDMHVY